MNHFQKIAEYSNEVNLKANEVAHNYRNTLEQFEKVPELTEKMLSIIGTQLPEEQREILSNIVEAVSLFYSENEKNFGIFLEFTNWNIEKSQMFIEEWSNQIS